MAVACNLYECVTVSLPKRPRNGRYASETATWIQKWFKKTRWNFLESPIYNGFSVE
jgi:hypothetical protein